MGWVNCKNGGAAWTNIWHLSPKNKDVPRNPALFLNMNNRFLYPCFTNK